MHEKQKLIHYTKFWKPDIKEDVLLFNGHFNSFEFDKHAHEEYTITLVHDSNMRAFINGFSKQFNQYSMLTINPDEIHACKTEDDKGYNYSSIYFNASMLDKISQEEFNSQKLYFKESAIYNPTLYHKLSFLVKANESGEISQLEFESKLVEAIKEILVTNSSGYLTNTKNGSKEVITKAKEFINDNFALDITLDDFATHLNISKYHFLRTFKEQTFLSPHEYLMNRRIEKAKQFLQGGDSLVATAHACGFNDQSHLSRRFKSFVGLTPGQYQKFFN